VSSRTCGYESEGGTLCEQVLCSVGTRNRHFREHSGEKPYRCDDCGTSHPQRVGLEKHERSLRHLRVVTGRGRNSPISHILNSGHDQIIQEGHTRTKALQAIWNENPDKSASALLEEYMSKNGIEPPFHCRICDKETSGVEALQEHEKSVLHKQLVNTITDLTSAKESDEQARQAALLLMQMKQSAP